MASAACATAVCGICYRRPLLVRVPSAAHAVERVFCARGIAKNGLPRIRAYTTDCLSHVGTCACVGAAAACLVAAFSMCHQTPSTRAADVYSISR